VYPDEDPDHKASAEECKTRENKQLMSRAVGVHRLKKIEIENLKKELAALQPFLGYKLEDLAKTAEPVFMNEHFCNSNLTA
jgi:hypothetical protein